MADEGCSTQLIDGDGVFNFSGIEKLTESVKLGNCGLSYAIVSILGPQSSVYPAYQTMLGHIRSKTLESFKEAFDKALNKGEKFTIAVQECTQTHMSLLKMDVTEKLSEALLGPVEALLDVAGNETWPAIRNLLHRETQSAVSGLSHDLLGFDIDQKMMDSMINDLKVYGRNVVETKAREEAGRILIRMKDRFSTLFSRDADSMPRVWTGTEDIRAITKNARSASLKLLSIMSSIRLDDDNDDNENTLSVALMDTGKIGRDGSISFDPLASSSWEKVPSTRTLITPVQCKSLWRQFKAETEYSVTQAMSAQDAHRRSNNWLPPPWAIVAIIVLGFNEFMTLLRNPLYLGIIFIAYLLGRALWVQLNISEEFRNGALPGILSLSTKFLPTVMNLLKKLAEEGQRSITSDTQGNH